MFPVVEYPPDVSTFWLGLPEHPWPTFIELSDSTSSGDAALVGLALATYGHEGPEPLSPERLEQEFPCALAGGFAATLGNVTIFPSCCCGLEAWREWTRVTVTGDSPWLGHDPAPWVDVSEDGVTIWADGGLSDAAPPDTQKLVTSREELILAIEAARSSLEAFVSTFERGMTAQGVHNAAALARLFQEVFVEGREHDLDRSPRDDE